MVSLVLFITTFYLMHMAVLPANMSVFHVHVWYQQRPEKGIGFPGTGITGNCELPCGCWESNWAPLEEQPVLLPTERSRPSYATFI